VLARERCAALRNARQQRHPGPEHHAGQSSRERAVGDLGIGLAVSADDRAELEAVGGPGGHVSNELREFRGVGVGVNQRRGCRSAVPIVAAFERRRRVAAGEDPEGAARKFDDHQRQRGLV
jgi:hypothetical protein